MKKTAKKITKKAPPKKRSLSEIIRLQGLVIERLQIRAGLLEEDYRKLRDRQDYFSTNLDALVVKVKTPPEFRTIAARVEDLCGAAKNLRQWNVKIQEQIDSMRSDITTGIGSFAADTRALIKQVEELNNLVHHGDKPAVAGASETYRDRMQREQQIKAAREALQSLKVPKGFYAALIPIPDGGGQ